MICNTDREYARQRNLASRTMLFVNNYMYVRVHGNMLSNSAVIYAALQIHKLFVYWNVTKRCTFKGGHFEPIGSTSKDWPNPVNLTTGRHGSRRDSRSWRCHESDSMVSLDHPDHLDSTQLADWSWLADGRACQLLITFSITHHSLYVILTST